MRKAKIVKVGEGDRKEITVKALLMGQILPLLIDLEEEEEKKSEGEKITPKNPEELKVLQVKLQKEQKRKTKEKFVELLKENLGIELKEFQEFSVNEFNQLWEAFKEVNADFFGQWATDQKKSEWIKKLAKEIIKDLWPKLRLGLELLLDNYLLRLSGLLRGGTIPLVTPSPSLGECAPQSEKTSITENRQI